MESSCIQLSDIPDEIVLIILNKLSNIDILYSVLNVNKRLFNIIYHSMFINRLTLLINIMNFDFRSLSAPILDRFCSQILPKIREKILWLDLEPFSMERILGASNYQNLFGFGLYNIQKEVALYLFNDKSPFTWAFKDQICSLVISINLNEDDNSSEYTNTLIFTRIISTFIQLRFLNICPSSVWNQQLSFDAISPDVRSSTLLELHVFLANFNDCLYLLDGRFNQLRKLYVCIHSISSAIPSNYNQKKLPNLTSFSLYCSKNTHGYDKLIVPLLQRMSVLDKLDLCVKVWRRNKFVDGNDLKRNVIDHLPFLNKFTFNIVSINRFINQMYIRSNEDIQHTFNGFKNNKIISCVDYFQERNISKCHIYTDPYQLIYYNDITNQFPGGIFKCVRKVSLSDEHPFEHEFFLQIQKSFPLMEELSLINRKQQNNQTNNENKNLPIINYSHIINLDLIQIHEDYLEQFLLDTKMLLPTRIVLTTDYQLLKKVTHNFTRDETRNNCAKLRIIFLFNKSEFPGHLKDYFPIAKIP